MKAPLYDAAGKSLGEIDLPESVFGVRWNADLVHQTTTAMQTAARAPIAHAKTRGEVRGGGRKPWKQKGTGRARHGSTRSPIWVGGGKAHGPLSTKNYDRKINRRAGAKALAVVLSQKFRDGEVVFVDALSFAGPKTADAKKMITAIAKGSGQARLVHRTNAALIAVGEKSVALEKSFRNFGNVSIAEARSLNPVDALRAKVILIAAPDVSIAQIASRLAPRTVFKTGARAGASGSVSGASAESRGVARATVSGETARPGRNQRKTGPRAAASRSKAAASFEDGSAAARV